MICLENGQVYDVNQALINKFKKYNLNPWINNENINDFNFRLVYDDNHPDFYKNIKDLTE